jgi:hypothetical protein
MSDLANQTPASTYKGLLQVGDYTDGVDSTVKAVLDGEGTASALAIGTTKVGVGTTSPSQELDVNGNVVATTLTTSGAVTAGSVSTSGAVGAGSVDVSGNVVADEYALDQTGASSSAVAIHAPATNELAIRTNSTEAMRIDSNGNCGIGTDDPSAKLEVLQSSATNTLTEVASFLGGNYDSVSNAESFKFFHQTTSLNTNRGVAFKSIDGSLQIQTIVSSSDISESNNISLQPDGGRCGIGTSNPDFNLSVVSDTDPAKIGIHGYGSFSDGTVAAQLYFVGKDSDGGNRNLAHIQVREHDHTLGSGSMEFVTRISGIEDARMTINEDGNVGIGTDSPSAPLEVASTTGGLIMPRMTTTQMNAISSPTDGEMIYNTTENKFYGRANGAWTALH